MKAKKGIKEGFRNTKDTYYDNGSKALSSQESLESTKQSLEDWCEKQIRRYGDKKVWGNTAEEEIKPVLISYIKNAQHKDIGGKNDVENYAFRVAIGRYAMQLAKRYGIDVYDEWSRVNEEAKRGKTLNESKIRKIVTESLKRIINEVGETQKGQKKLGKLASYRQKQAEDSYFKGDEEKFQDYMKRSSNANRYAGNKIEDGDESDRQSKIKAFQKGEKKGERKKLKEDIRDNGMHELCNLIKNIYKSARLQYRMSEYEEVFRTAIQNGYSKDDLINAFCKCGLDCTSNPRSIERFNNIWNSLCGGQTKNPYN
jgi:hypothetical protein